MNAVAPAAAVLAVALLVASPAPGRLRLRALHRPGADPLPARADEPPLRPAWAAVAAAAAGALGWASIGPVAGVVACVAAGGAAVVLIRRAGSRAAADGDVELAGRWELLAVCLRSGMPVATSVAAGAEPLAGLAGARLRRIAGLLALGADPADAWRTASDVPALASFARAAARSAGTGAALAEVAAAEGTRIRAAVADSAQARAQRAAVMITGPLGLCFLPSFLVLGIGPVVIGLAGAVLARW